MHRLSHCVALFAIALLACVPPVAADHQFSLNGGIPNLELASKAQQAALKEQIRSYYDSGRQAQDVARVEARAQSYIDQRVKAGARKPALVLDIDDTSLSSYTYEIAENFGYDAASWNEWMTDGKFPVMPATLALAAHVQREGVAVFFVTGRREAQRAATARELHALGYIWTGLYLRPPSDHRKSVIPFKSSARATIAAAGYDVLASIGDQWSDSCGGSTERLYKLPNPMYYLP